MKHLWICFLIFNKTKKCHPIFPDFHFVSCPKYLPSDEIENFEMQLEKEEKKLRDLEGDHVRSLADVDKSQKKIKKLETKATRYQEKMEVLQQELEAKDELVSFRGSLG